MTIENRAQGEAIAFEAVGIAKAFSGGGGIAVDTLRIRRGKVTAILGLSGTGKSTLLGLLGGIVAADPGASRLQVEIGQPGSAPIDLLAAKGQGRFEAFGFVFQNPHLLRNATGIMNISVALSATGKVLGLDDLVARAGDVELKPELLVKRARQLSGGEKQRTAIGRGIVRDPDVLFADEPTANLDPRNGLKIMGQICRWQRQAPERRSVVWVTHNILEASIFADEIVLLEPGETNRDVGRLMRHQPGWRHVAQPAVDAPLWPMPNPRDPRTLAAMLFRALFVDAPSSEARVMMDHARGAFAERAGETHSEASLVAAALALSAVGIIGAVGLHPATAMTPVTEPRSSDKKSPTAPGPMVGRWSIARIGIGELLGRSKAADLDPTLMPRPVSRLVGLPDELVDSLRAAKSNNPSSRRKTHLVTAGVLLLVALAVATGGAWIGWPGTGTRAMAGVIVAFAAVQGVFAFVTPRATQPYRPWLRPASRGFLSIMAFAGAATWLSARYVEIEPWWTLPAVGAALMLIAGVRLIALAADNLQWSARAYGRWFHSAIFVAIAVFLYALVLARESVKASFDTSLRSLELGHVVVALKRSGANLDQSHIEREERLLREKIATPFADLDRTWRTTFFYEPLGTVVGVVGAGLRLVEAKVMPVRPPAAADRADDDADRQLIFGRWLQTGRMVQLPVRRDLADHELKPDIACVGEGGPTDFRNADIMAASGREPALSRLAHLEGETLATLKRDGKRRTNDDLDAAMREDRDHLMGVIVSKKLLSTLDRLTEARNNQKPSGKLPTPKHLCLYGPVKEATQLVRVVAVVEDLPKEQLIDAVHVLVPRALFEHVDASTQGYDTAAIYFKDPRLIAPYSAFFKERAGAGTILPDAFTLIQKSLETSETLIGYIDYIIWGVILFAMLLVALLTSSFITENEKSLCVMRAFGVRLRQIAGLVSLQMLVVWSVAALLSLAVVRLSAPLIEEALRRRLDAEATALRGTLGSWYEAMGLMTLSVILASIVASAVWWRNTRNVGDRLKELE